MTSTLETIQEKSVAELQWNDIREEIEDILNDDRFRHGGDWHKYLLKWANKTIESVAQEIDIRFHLVLETSRTFTTTDASVSLPDNFFKISDRFTKARVGEDYINIVRLEDLYKNDPDHDGTTDNDAPDEIAVEGGRVYVQPMFSGTLILENYFRKPVKMADGTDSIDLQDDEVVEDLIQAGVLRRGFRMQGDMDLAREHAADFSYYLDLYRDHLDTSDSREQAKFNDF